MKQLLIIVVMGLLPIVASAQKGLAIERVMKNISEYSSHNDQVHMEGNSVSAYGLSLFESLVAHQSAKAVDVMREAALADNGHEGLVGHLRAVCAGKSRLEVSGDVDVELFARIRVEKALEESDICVARAADPGRLPVRDQRKLAQP